MKTIAILLAGLLATSCALREDGVGQCEETIRATLDSPAFLKRLPDEAGDVNTAHPNREADYDQRWIDINYEMQEPGMGPVVRRHECVFRLRDGRVDALISAGDRNPRLADYGVRATSGQ